MPIEAFIRDHANAFEAFSARAHAATPGALEVRGETGWSPKEMIAHVAFWEEADVAVILYMQRGKEIPMPWQFGSGPFNEPEWPSAEVHNAREAAWARGQDIPAVLARLTRAHEELVTALGTVTNTELDEHRTFFEAVVGHLREHLDELPPTAAG